MHTAQITQSFYLHKYTANCDDGDVKLIGGLSAIEGYVVVCYNKRWGHICDTYREATVKTVCKQLGFSGGECVCCKDYNIDNNYFW